MYILNGIVFNNNEPVKKRLLVMWCMLPV